METPAGQDGEYALAVDEAGHSVKIGVRVIRNEGPARTPHSHATLKTALSTRATTFGGWLQLPSPDVAEIIAEGFDWVVCDLEHGGLDRGTLVHLVRAIEGKGKLPLARLMAGDPLLGRQALDAGCAGLIVPHVSSAEAFAAFAEVCTWPPNGTRSIGFFRGNGFGQRFHEHAELALDPIIIPMIESRAGLASLDAILGTGRADAVLIGPYDLSASLGAVGDFASAAYRDAEEQVLAACARHGVAAGVHDVTSTPSSIADKVSRGYTFIACGTDTVFLTQAVATITSFEELGNVDRS